MTDPFSPVEVSSRATVFYPVALVEAASGKLRNAMRERNRLRDVYYEAKQTHDTLRSVQAVEEAKRQDDELLSRAVASGSTDPGEVHFHALQDEVRAAYRVATGAKLALEAAQREVDLAFATPEGDRWVSDLGKTRGSLVDKLAKQVAEIKTTIREIATVEGNTEWAGQYVTAARGEFYETRNGFVSAREPMGLPRIRTDYPVGPTPYDSGFMLDNILNLWVNEVAQPKREVWNPDVLNEVSS